MRASPRLFGPESIDSRMRAGLIGAWSGGGASATWFDRSGYGHHGGLTGTPVWGRGADGKRSAPRFDAVDDACAIDASIYGRVNSLAGTYAAWVSLSAMSTNGAWQFLRANASNAISLSWRNAGNNIRLLYLAGGTESAAFSSAVLDTDPSWHHVAGTWDKANDEVRLYVDAVQAGATVTGLGTWAGAITSVLIGNNTSNERFAGVIDDARLYTRALSAAEILLLSKG